jgi:hypothetical protein
MEQPPRYKLLHDPTSKFTISRTGHLYELESVNYREVPVHLEGVKRSSIHGLSRDSRRRMIKEVSSYGSRKPVFVTTTYNDPMPTCEEAKRHNKLFMQRLLYQYPDYWILWRLEFQPKSGRPHFHYLIYSKGKDVFIPSGCVKKLWREVTDREALEPRIEGLRSHRGGLYYCTKYLCKEDLEGFELYKKTHPNTKTGRFWGVQGRDRKPNDTKDLQVSAEDFKYILITVLRDKAERELKRDLRVKGDSWEAIEASLGTEEAEKEIRKRTRHLFKSANGTPTWTLSENQQLVEGMVRTAKASYNQDDLDYVFTFC